MRSLICSMTCLTRCFSFLTLTNKQRCRNVQFTDDMEAQTHSRCLSKAEALNFFHFFVELVRLKSLMKCDSFNSVHISKGTGTRWPGKVKKVQKLWSNDVKELRRRATADTDGRSTASRHGRRPDRRERNESAGDSNLKDLWENLTCCRRVYSDQSFSPELCEATTIFLISGRAQSTSTSTSRRLHVHCKEPFEFHCCSFEYSVCFVLL